MATDLPPPTGGGSAEEPTGRASWRMVTAFLLIAVGAAGGLFYVNRLGHSQTPDYAGGTNHGLRAEDLRQIPKVQFRDITEAAGIDFLHVNGATGDKLLPETMGGGVGFCDYDSDGDQDLLFVNSGTWPGSPLAKSNTVSALSLYQNDGRGRFQNVTKAAKLEIPAYGMGLAVGDYDNDGRPDLFVSAVGENKLFHNEGATFQQVHTMPPAETTNGNWSTSAAFLDYDNDGDLDLFVCSYVQWSAQLDFKVDYRLPGIGRAYGPPHNFSGSFPLLYRNDGQGKFVDVSAASGVQIRNPANGLPAAKAMGVSPVDLDNDGWIDLVIANDTVQNFVFQNQKNGTFREIGAHSGIAFDTYGQIRGAMGIDSARFRNDSALGIAIGNFANEMNALYVSQPDSLLFADEAISHGVGKASQTLLKFGLFFFDYDLDGRLDVLTANGHLEEQIAQVDSSQSYRQPAQLFWNRGTRGKTTFLPVPPSKSGHDIFQPLVGRGSAYADIDSDGDLDVVLTQIAARPVLLRNDQDLGHHWLRVRLVGRKSNRDGIGSWVHVQAGGRTLSRQVMPTKGYLSQSELPVTIGLGKTTKVDELEIVWPGGQRQKILNPAIDKVLTVTQE